MKARDLQNMIRILGSIDKHEIDHILGDAMPMDQWETFRDAPCDFFIRCDDSTARAIWAIVASRHTAKLVDGTLFLDLLDEAIEQRGRVLGGHFTSGDIAETLKNVKAVYLSLACGEPLRKNGAPVFATDSTTLGERPAFDGADA